ncbi:vWA domain-containing protein, partial [Nakamurella sp.]|uniref:vWA domain-containing protein n=1 Tax=Nakamurella sp. TaxID=1869182 RepID=UPI003B3B4695
MPELSRGANAPLTADQLSVHVRGARPGVVDLMAFQLTADRRVRTDDDLVFFNQPASPEGAVRLTGPDVLTLDLRAVPEVIETVAVTVALDDAQAGSLADIAGLGVGVGPDGYDVPAQGLTTERAAVLAEVYRRAGAWKLRSVSAGWTEGLAALVREHGVQVDDEAPPAAAHPAAPPPPVAPPPAAAPTPNPASAPALAPAPADGGPRSVPGEERLSLVKRQALDLRKREVHRVLLTKGAQTERARVVLVIDKTGSMYQEYKSRLIHRVVERMVPVAIQLDTDGSLETYLYAKTFARLPDLRVADLETWPEEFLHLNGTHGGINYRKLGGSNDEIPILTELAGSVRPGGPPTLVLFFTDGGFYKRKEITRIISEAAARPVFWQFVGIGANDYGLLEKLDDMAGRVVDNVDFFALDDIDRVPDAELYRR